MNLKPNVVSLSRKELPPPVFRPKVCYEFGARTWGAEFWGSPDSIPRIMRNRFYKLPESFPSPPIKRGSTKLVIVTPVHVPPTLWNGHYNLLIRPDGWVSTPMLLDCVAFPPGYNPLHPMPGPTRKYCNPEHPSLYSISVGLLFVRPTDITKLQVASFLSSCVQFRNRYGLDILWGVTVIEPALWQTQVVDKDYGEQHLVRQLRSMADKIANGE